MAVCHCLTRIFCLESHFLSDRGQEIIRSSQSEFPQPFLIHLSLIIVVRPGPAGKKNRSTKIADLSIDKKVLKNYNKTQIC